MSASPDVLYHLRVPQASFDKPLCGVMSALDDWLLQAPRPQVGQPQGCKKHLSRTATLSHSLNKRVSNHHIKRTRLSFQSRQSCAIFIIFENSKLYQCPVQEIPKLHEPSNPANSPTYQRGRMASHIRSRTLQSQMAALTILL